MQLLHKQFTVIWLAWLAICSSSLAGQASGRAVKQHYSDLLHAFLHKPFLHAKHPAMPDHLHQQQQQMLEAMHRHKHQDLHLMLQQQRQPQQQLPGQVHSSTSKAAPGAKSTSVAHTGAATGPAAGAAGLNASIARLPQQELLHVLHDRWPEGYVAICAIVKDQSRDLRYWIEYHRWLGVSKFYIFDNNSTLPAMLVLWDYIKTGVVDYQYFVGRPRRKPDFADTNQYRAYHGCLLQHFRQHRWLAFIDIDEFLVFLPDSTPLQAGQKLSPAAGAGTRRLAAATADDSATQDESSAATDDATAVAEDQDDDTSKQPEGAKPDGTGTDSGSRDNTSSFNSSTNSSTGARSKQHLAAFLAKYEQHAAVGINWVLFGSSGLQERPLAGPLASYTSCVPREHWESTHVKVIANTGGILGVGPTPHEVVPRAGRSIVDVDGKPFKGPKTAHAKWHKLVMHHYVLKSRAEFANKKARGSGAGNVKDWAFFDYMDKLSNQTCSWGMNISHAFFASKPQLRLPKAARLLSNMRSQRRAAAATAPGAGDATLAADASTVKAADDEAAADVAANVEGGGGKLQVQQQQAVGADYDATDDDGGGGDLYAQLL